MSAVGRSHTFTVSSGSETGVVAIGTISGLGGGKATLRPFLSGGVVDRVSRATATEHVVLTSCLLSINQSINQHLLTSQQYTHSINA